LILHDRIVARAIARRAPARGTKAIVRGGALSARVAGELGRWDYWQLRDGRIELSKIGVHEDLSIV
jgi:hypothetical protein